MIDELKQMLSDRDILIEKLRKENDTLKGEKKLSDKNRFDGKPSKTRSRTVAPIHVKRTRQILTAVPLPGLSAEEITRQRNSLWTKDIIGRMRSFLNVLTSEEHLPRRELMEKAVNY